jgi:predicted DsbA family dithiol-disulfide isomerase
VRQLVSDDQAEAHRLAIRGTPTFLIGIRIAPDQIQTTHKITGARPFDVFKDVVRQLLETLQSN